MGRMSVNSIYYWFKKFFPEKTDSSSSGKGGEGRAVLIQVMFMFSGMMARYISLRMEWMLGISMVMDKI